MLSQLLILLLVSVPLAGTAAQKKRSVAALQERLHALQNKFTSLTTAQQKAKADSIKSKKKAALEELKRKKNEALPEGKEDLADYYRQKSRLLKQTTGYSWLSPAQMADKIESLAQRKLTARITKNTPALEQLTAKRNALKNASSSAYLYSSNEQSTRASLKQDKNKLIQELVSTDDPDKQRRLRAEINQKRKERQAVKTLASTRAHAHAAKQSASQEIKSEMVRGSARTVLGIGTGAVLAAGGGVLLQEITMGAGGHDNQPATQAAADDTNQPDDQPVSEPADRDPFKALNDLIEAVPVNRRTQRPTPTPEQMAAFSKQVGDLLDQASHFSPDDYNKLNGVIASGDQKGLVNRELADKINALQQPQAGDPQPSESEVLVVYYTGDAEERRYWINNAWVDEQEATSALGDNTPVQLVPYNATEQP